MELKKHFSKLGAACGVFFAATLISLLFVSCASTDYIEENYDANVQKLVSCAPYTDEPVEFTSEYLVDEVRAAEIREYFKANAGLDLDALAASEKTTWEKAVELAVFVAKNIPHNNQKEWLQERNAITLWEYSRRFPSGFNCRWHSTILSELMLSIGIKNRFITCLPEDKDDGDCHVVNIVWLPENEQWAMIDSDMVEYVTGEGGKLLSLAEMREYVIAGKPFTVNVLPGFENSWVAAESGLKYMQAYWAKNLYWFALHSTYGFDLEGTRTLPDTYVCLVPPGYDCSDSSNGSVVTTNAVAFWGE